MEVAGVPACLCDPSVVMRRVGGRWRRFYTHACVWAGGASRVPWKVSGPHGGGESEALGAQQLSLPPFAPLPPDCEPARPARSLQCPGSGTASLCLTHRCRRPLGPSASCSFESYASRTVLMAKAKRYEGWSDPCVQSSDLRTPGLTPIRPSVARRCHRGTSADAGSEAVGATRAAQLAVLPGHRPGCSKKQNPQGV